MRAIPWIAKKWLFLFVFIATLLGISLDILLGNKIDYWIHDTALLFQARSEWKFSGIVVLDNHVPIQVSRKQALPLFARATEILIAAGAKGVFLDAGLAKENEGVMPYADCIEANGDVRWSLPECSVNQNQCLLNNSLIGNAPLKMSGEVFNRFRIAPYLENQAGLPDFLLYGLESEPFIPKSGLVALDRLITKNTPIARWMDLTPNHADVIMANFISPERIKNVLNEPTQELCDQNLPCRRIRFSLPHYDLQNSPKQPILPVSLLAACDRNTALTAAAAMKGRVVILQLTTPYEATDVVITPITTSLFGPHLLTPGAQYLADAIETLLNNDHPQAPNFTIKLLLFLCIALISVYSSAYLQQLSWLWLIGGLIFLSVATLCCLLPVLQLWPVTVSLITFATGALLTIAMHLLIGFKEGHLILQYMPKQVHNLLLSLKPNEMFKNQRYQAIVLMSDLAGYTTVTGILKEPVHILNLMNDYLDQTTFVLQDRYEGWLETYIGDMVCYYWPYKPEHEANAFKNSLLGAIELTNLQKRFFSELTDRYRNIFDADMIENMQKIMNAGIGLSSGSVVMGDLGPKRGVRKFGILGDPMNLTARAESLTRHFNTEIIVTIDFIPMTRELYLPTRRLGTFRLKGREQPIQLYALGQPNDLRFQTQFIEAWEAWLIDLEQATNQHPPCPEIFNEDSETLLKWHARGLLKAGIWYLEEK